MIYALLKDDQGSVLLVRRRGSVLWSLPGGENRPSAQWDDLLTSYCLRQVGVAPEAFDPRREITFAGVRCLVAGGAASRVRAGARGRIQAINWVPADKLPTDTDPMARVAVVTLMHATAAAPTAPVANAAPAVPTPA